MVNTNSTNSKIERIFFSQHWLRAIESDVAPQIVIELTSASGGFVLQNTIHWIKSIAIDTATEKTKPSDPHLSHSPGRGESDAKRQVRIEATVKTFGHFKPINSKRFLNDCHEYIFHFTKIRSRRAESAGAWRSVPGQKQHRAMVVIRAGDDLTLSRQHVVHSLRRQFRAARKNDHTPRHFRFNWPNGASNCTASRESKRCLIRFSASEIPPSPRSAVA